MESMWISFESHTERRYAIRPFLGRVNGISGEAAIGDIDMIMRRINLVGPKKGHTLREDRPKLVGNLWKEAPAMLEPPDLVELTVFHRQAEQWKFEARTEDCQKTVSLKVSKY